MPAPPVPDDATASGLTPETLATYRRAMTTLREAEVPFLVGGAYAFGRYTGIIRHTKDFDVFVRPADLAPALEALAGAGFRTEVPFPHWLGKAHAGDDFIDVIFSSGNGLARVDDQWFENAVEGEVLGEQALLCPAEEMLWSKAFIMERERFDGGDVAHLLLARARELDWRRLLSRFAGHEPVLLSHLLLFDYIYPGETGAPREVIDELLVRTRAATPPVERLCRGPILSRGQYLADIEERGYRDARLAPLGAMGPDEVAIWTRAAREEEQKNIDQH
ncbi:MAG TPA: hypothetical protein VEG34_15730 [Thermoanaerobaculia bacterium]|nr:hypothetical protein [Thermoanaerobaculia bacterium]